MVWNFQTVSRRRHPSLYIPKFPNVVQVHGYLYLCTHGTTPLDIAIRNNQSRNVQMLVESGAHQGLGIRCGRGIRFSGSALWTHVDGKKRMDWTYLPTLNCKPSFILEIVSIHIFFRQTSRLCQSYWKNACLAKKGVEHRVFLLVFLLQDSWGFLKASKEEQRQRSKVSPEDSMGIWLYKL